MFNDEDEVRELKERQSIGLPISYEGDPEIFQNAPTMRYMNKTFKKTYDDITTKLIAKKIADSIREVCEPYIGKKVGEINPEEEARKLTDNLKEFYKIVAPELDIESISVTPSDKDGVYNISVPMPYYKFTIDVPNEVNDKLKELDKEE